MSQQLVYRRPLASSSSYNNLIEAQTYLDKLRIEQPIVVRHLSMWVKHRKLTIDTVDELRKRLDDIFISCNVVRGVGAVAGIGGLVAGIVEFFADGKTASQCKEVRNICAGAGMVAIAASTLAEHGLSQSAMNEIKRILEKDRELTEPLRNWIWFSNEINTRFNNIFQCNIATDMFLQVWRVCRQCMKVINAGISSVEYIIRNLGNRKIKGIEYVTEEVRGLVVNFLKDLIISPELRQPLTEIFDIFQDGSDTFEFTKLGSIVYENSINFLQSKSISLVMSHLGLHSATASGRGLVGQGKFGLGAILLAFNVVTLILSVENLIEGESKYSEALKEVNRGLRLELNEVRNQMSTIASSIQHDARNTYYANSAICYHYNT